MHASTKIGRASVAVWWVIVVIWAGFIFFMSAHTGNDLDTGSGIIGWIKHQLTSLAVELFGPGTDAVSVAAHFFEYTVFGVLLTVAITHTRRYRLLGTSVFAVDWHKFFLISATLAIVIASLYGITDEFHQTFVPGRVCDPADWITDTLGAALGALITAFLLRRVLH